MLGPLKTLLVWKHLNTIKGSKNLRKAIPIYEFLNTLSLKILQIS